MESTGSRNCHKMQKITFILSQRQQPRAWEQGQGCGRALGQPHGQLGVPRGDPAHRPWWFAAKMKRISLLWGKSPCFPPRPAREAPPWAVAPCSKLPRGAPAWLG